MKLCIYGSRGCTPSVDEVTIALEQWDTEMLFGKSPTLLISGGARGADEAGERWAAAKGIEVRQYLADWDRYGKGAGFRRNHEMAKECDLALGFWDGLSNGAKDMTTRLVLLDKPVHVVLWRKR